MDDCFLPAWKCSLVFREISRLQTKMSRTAIGGGSDRFPDRRQSVEHGGERKNNRGSWLKAASSSCPRKYGRQAGVEANIIPS